jgi:hypothetical protein
LAHEGKSLERQGQHTGFGLALPLAQRFSLGSGHAAGIPFNQRGAIFQPVDGSRKYCPHTLVENREAVIVLSDIYIEFCGQHCGACTIHLRRKHSAVESATNALENHGPDCRPDRGIMGFKRYVGLAVLARNIQRIGALLQKRRLQEIKRHERVRQRFQQAACSPESRV